MDRRKRNFIIFTIIFVVSTAMLSFIFWPFIRELGNPVYREEFSRKIGDLGWKGPLIVLGIMVLQVVVAVIPGGPVELLAGAAYGALGGTALCLAGSISAGFIIFLMVRKFGAPLVEKFFRGTGRFTFLQNTRKISLVVFILFLIPGTPKDTLTYLAPLSGISLGRFLILSSLARIPAILSTAILGDQAIRGNWTLSLLIFALVAVLGISGILFSGWIVNKLRETGEKTEEEIIL